MPIYGNSVLAVKDGTLDMHGKTPVRTYAKLKTGLSAGDTVITLEDMNGDTLDW